MNVKQKTFINKTLPKKLGEKFLTLSKPYTKATEPIYVKCLKCNFEFTVCYTTLFHNKSNNQTPCYNCQGKVINEKLLEESIKQNWKILNVNKNKLGYIGKRTSKLKLECKICNYQIEVEGRHAANKVCPKCANNPDLKNHVKGIIYKLICKPSNKVYVGQTIQSFQKRVRGHIRHSQKDNNPAYYGKLACAIRKYGINHFDFEVLHHDVPWDKLDELEIQEIKNHNSYHDGLNCTEGGNIGSRSAGLAKQRFDKYVRKKKEQEVKQRAAQQQRALTNFEKNLEKDLKMFTKQARNDKDKLTEHMHRVVGAKRQAKERQQQGKSSQYIGVCYDKGNSKRAKKDQWRAAIKHEGKKIYLGLFDDEVSAANAYDQKCLQLRGLKAKTNF